MVWSSQHESLYHYVWLSTLAGGFFTLAYYSQRYTALILFILQILSFLAVKPDKQNK